MPSFPYKLHTLLEVVTADEELSTIISWLPDGKSFRIHSQEEFEKRVLKDYFPRQKQVKSFMRQLQYYNFENYGDGLFCHPCFRRGQRNLCGQILHQLPTKSQKVCGRSTRPLKQRGRKKKCRSQSLDSSPELAMAPYTVGLSSPEPSLPDDASSSSSIGASTGEPRSSLDQRGRGPQLDPVSPNSVKAIPTKGSDDVNLNAQTVQSFFNSAVLPSVPEQAAASYLTPHATLTGSSMLPYDIQAFSAARSNYLSCLQQEIMIGSILNSQRRICMEQPEEDKQLAIKHWATSQP